MVILVCIGNSSEFTAIDANSNLDRFDLTWNFYQFVSSSTVDQTSPDFVFESITSGTFDYGKLPFTGENGVNGNNYIYMIVNVFDKHTGQNYDSQITQVRLSCLDYQIDKFCSCKVDSNSTFTYNQNGGGDIQIDQLSGECEYPQARLIETSNVLGDQSVCSTQEHFANKRYPSCISTYICDQGFSAVTNSEIINSSQVQNCNIISTDQNGVDTWGWEPFVESFSEIVTCGGIDFQLTCDWNM